MRAAIAEAGKPDQFKHLLDARAVRATAERVAGVTGDGQVRE